MKCQAKKPLHLLQYTSLPADLLLFLVIVECRYIWLPVIEINAYYPTRGRVHNLLQYPHNVPSLPWKKLATDLFDYQGAQYLLITDYYRKYPIVRKLNSTTSAAVINHLKLVFAEHGIPEILVSNNGPQYNSQEFAAFCKQWGIDHVTSSPLYPQSNGFIERSVQTVKKLLRKAEASGQDPYLVMLAYRTSPVDSNLLSPAQLLNHRDYPTQSPCSGRLQHSQAFDKHREQLQNR